jgi:hypothetical protein
MKAYLKKNLKIDDKEIAKDSPGYVRSVFWGDKTKNAFIYFVDFDGFPMTPVSLNDLYFSSSQL